MGRKEKEKVKITRELTGLLVLFNGDKGEHRSGNESLPRLINEHRRKLIQASLFPSQQAVSQNNKQQVQTRMF